MGWFDGDSSSDDDNNNKKKQAKKPMLLNFDDDDDDKDETKQDSRSNNNNNNINSKNNDKNTIDNDEIDPLDAYMNTLDTTKKNKSHVERAERLDVENEEEATSHWENKKSATSTTDDQQDDQNNSEPEYDIKTAAARDSLNSTFHKAGSNNDNGSSSSSSRQVNIVLEKVHHESMKYPPFEKKFWTMIQNSATESTNKWRNEHDISCSMPMIDPMYTFEELQQEPQLLKWIYSNNYQKPTLVQSQAIPVILSGYDAMITASTGSGKTLAYLWPIFIQLSNTINQQSQCKALILVPTRELALQVQQYAKSISKSLMQQQQKDNNNNNNNAQYHLSSIAITGGTMGRYQLSKELYNKDPNVVIATPGRLLDVLSVKQYQFDCKKYFTTVVLDEADKMLQLGFASQVTQILESIRPDRQTILLSATMGNKIKQLAESKWLQKTNTCKISIGRTGQSSLHVSQQVMVLPNDKAKDSFLQEMITTFVQVGRTLIFCATRDGCERLATLLSSSPSSSSSSSNTTSLSICTLHGDKHQADRVKAMQQFSKQSSNVVLIATDVAGRGLDIPHIATVINYDPAKNLDTHVHRIGRAGRLQASTGTVQTGTAYTLLLPTQSAFAKILESSFIREGRDVSPELANLAKRSSHAKAVEYDHYSNQQENTFRRKQSNVPYGLGYNSTTTTTTTTTTTRGNNNNYDNDGNPPRKKSRWN